MFNVDDEYLELLDNFDVKIIGERLKQIRIHIGNVGPNKITQSQISDLLKLKDLNTTLSNLENGKGTILNFIKLILLYHSQGYNINWIILPNNKFEEMTLYGNSPKQSITKIDIHDLSYNKNQKLKKAIKALEIANKEIHDALKY